MRIMLHVEAFVTRPASSPFRRRSGQILPRRHAAPPLSRRDLATMACARGGYLNVRGPCRS